MAASKSDSTDLKFIDVYVVTFNCGRKRVKPEEFGPALFGALPQKYQKDAIATAQTSQTHDDSEANIALSAYPHLLVLSLQEVAPISYSYLGGRFLTHYFDGLREAVGLATDGQQIYENVVCENTGMTAIMVFARRDIMRDVVWVETAGAGVGVQETGHKGAAGVRLGYSIKSASESEPESTKQQTIGLTFVAAHLAPGEALLERRNEDWKKLARLMVFTNPANSRSSGQQIRELEEEKAPLLQLPRNTRGLYSPQSYLFVAGDFNYRTASFGPRPDDYTTFPQPTEDPNSPLHFSHLLSRDQLTRERTNQRTFHHLSEMPITFPPTYKIIHFPEGTPTFVHKAYNWARTRWPSWCDRVLYADASTYSGFQGLKPKSYHSLSVMSTSDHLPVAFLASVALKEIPAPEKRDTFQPPFEIDSTWKDRRTAARRKEIIAGFFFYLGLTREGNALFLMTAFVLGALYRYLS